VDESYVGGEEEGLPDRLTAGNGWREFAEHASSTRTGCCVIWGAGAASDELATARGRRLPILRRYKDDSDDPASVAMARSCGSNLL
jgi:hypothetical protein